MIEGNFAPQDVTVAEKRVVEKPAKKKRKIHVSAFRHIHFKKRDVSSIPVAPPEQKISFTSPKNLHSERGYDAFNFKRTMKKRKHSETAHSVAPTEIIPMSAAFLKTTEDTSSSPSQHANGNSENGNGFKKIHPSLYWLEQSSHALYRKAKPALSAIGEKSHDVFNFIKWGMGRLSRGNVVKRLQKMERNPELFSAEIQAEINRSITNVLTPEDQNILTRNKKNITQGTITALTILPAWIPTGLPFPFMIYTGGSLAITADNIYNTAQAFRQKRYRKTLAYSLMTLGGIATGFFPGAHNLTNTWYTELLQKTYDHTETEGMLKITQGLFDENAQQERKALGQKMVHDALTGTFGPTGTPAFFKEQLRFAALQRQLEKDTYLREIETVKSDHDKLPGFFRAFAHPRQIPNNLFTLFRLLSRSIDINQQLIDIEHKLQTIPQLEAIISASTSDTATLGE